MARPARFRRRLATVGLCIALFASALSARTIAAVLVVSNITDIVNGDTSSPADLVTAPGPDGISLREALLASNNAPGPHTVTFAPALGGQTIVLATRFAPITRDGIALVGPTSNGQPDITLDASQASNPGAIFFIVAPSFSVSGVRFSPIPVGFSAMQIGGSGFGLQGQPVSAPQQIRGFQIRGNAFAKGAGNNTFAIFIAHSVGSTSNATIGDVTIANNTFDQVFKSINIQGAGSNNVIEDVVIYGNTFTNNVALGTSAVELGNTVGTSNRITRTRILQNVFTGNFQGIVLNNNASAQSSLIDDTLIARNAFAGNLQALGVVAGVDTVTSSSAVANTRIVDNVISLTGYEGGGAAAIQVIDNQSGGTNNLVTGVSFINNTVNSSGPPGPPGAGFWVTSTGGVSGLVIANSIFWGSPSDELRGVAPAEVHNSIVNQAGFTGINGNIGSDPMFVNAAGGDFHPQPGSPAIGAGTTTGAPFGDAECKVRASPPAIGAYKSGNAPSCTQNVPLAAVLPASRSVQVGSIASAFASIINTGPATANACGLVPATSVPGALLFQTTDPATNALIGTPNTPVNIGAGAIQSFVFGFALSAAFTPTDVALEFTCADTLGAPVHVGLDTLLLSASASPVPDLIAIGATPSGDGIVNIPGTTGTGVFATAAINIGAAATITASADDGGAGLAANLSICQTNSIGACVNPAVPGPSATVAVGNNETVTFTVLVTGTGMVPLDPANNRLFLRLKDAAGLTRGATGVAVRTQ